FAAHERQIRRSVHTAASTYATPAREPVSVG
ncbi:MAG: hypothetical protein QOC79_2082, partial [Actinomycetota bacterium]|nr:hypothetical protein [Actinomycetota bacterium]